MSKEEPLNKKNAKQYIVGIGASAGGLEALQSFLSELPSNLGFSYVIIQHLSPDYKSLLGELLAKSTTMPVMQAENGMKVQPDCVYVIPPRKSIYLSEGTLLLCDQKTGGLHLPVDTLFNSLAKEAGSRAIAIIMSGTGSDGTNGIKSIKENNGIIIVQNPESSKFDGMPSNALRTGLADIQCSPKRMAAELVRIASAVQKNIFSANIEKQINDELMERIYYILQKISNINFTNYQQDAILQRVERRLILTAKNSLTEYVDYLYTAPEEARLLSKEVLVGVSSFFRDPEFFERLQEKAIKNIVLNSSSDVPIRVWAAGCSTGEEAYSLAILFCETMETLKIKRLVKIFATDIDAETVATAGKGVYGSSIASSVSSARLSRYFARQNNTYVINRDVRKMLVFSPHNVIQDPPFGKLDLISCRNLMIHFLPEWQKDLFAMFHAVLKDGGYLFLGSSETVGSYTDVFPIVDAQARIFTHHKNIKTKDFKTASYFQNILVENIYNETDQNGSRSITDHNISEQIIINTELLERFMPACLVVNERNELVYIYGDSRNYVAFPAGKITNSLFDVLVEQLRIPVSTALKEAREKQTTVQYRDIHFIGEHAEDIISLTVTPISKSKIAIDNLFALVFTEIKGCGDLPEAIPYEIDQMAAKRITNLEQELSQAQERLNKSVLKQECVNEELQAANEELLTANEELQSSNEELQSVNEELYTVNSEYQIKLTELADVNDDITNFLATTLIGMIFIDNKLSIRRFTNYIMSEFGIVEQDAGRPIDHLSHFFPGTDIITICNKVIKELKPHESEIITAQGKTFFMRVAPFRTTENKILGCVITLVDLTSQKQEHIRLQNTEVRLSLAQQASDAKSDYLLRMSQKIKIPMDELTRLSGLLQQQLDDRDNVYDYAQLIAENVDNMKTIIADTLKLAQDNDS